MNSRNWKHALLSLMALAFISADVSALGSSPSKRRWHRTAQASPPEAKPLEATNPSAKTPEIDAGSGTGAISLLTAAILLMRERARSHRS